MMRMVPLAIVFALWGSPSMALEDGSRATATNWVISSVSITAGDDAATRVLRIGVKNNSKHTRSMCIDSIDFLVDPPGTGSAVVKGLHGDCLSGAPVLSRESSVVTIKAEANDLAIASAELLIRITLLDAEQGEPLASSKKVELSWRGTVRPAVKGVTARVTPRRY